MKNLFSASSIGMISGADGPTAIFVTYSADWWMYALGAAAVIAAVIALVIIGRKKR